MAIEIYDKAKVITDGEKVYYFLKHGSRNSFTCGGQYVLDGNFNRKYIIRDSRDSTWHIVAIGTLEQHKQGTIGDTYWNAPTGDIYGRVCFGDKKNIALYFARQKPVLLSEKYDALQQYNIDSIIKHYTEGPAKEYVINLNDIPENKKTKTISREYNLNDNHSLYNGRKYWDLDNL